MLTVHNFVVSCNANKIKLDAFKDYPLLLIVNVPTAEFPFAEKHFLELEKLHKSFKSLSVLGIFCMQFSQTKKSWNPFYVEPNFDFDEEGERQVLISKYNITFPIFDKIIVNGPNEHSLFNFLKHRVISESLLSNFFSNSIKWNFTKFLCVNGVPVKRFEPSDSILVIETEIKKFL